MYCTVLYNTVLYCTQYCTVLYCTVLYCMGILSFLSVCLSVCVFEMHLIRNCSTALAEILHRGDGLSQTLHLSFWWRSPQGSRQGSRKCTTVGNIVSVYCVNLLINNLFKLLIRHYLTSCACLLPSTMSKRLFTGKRNPQRQPDK